MTQKEKINVAELLKDCPKGMELDCTMYDNVTFERFDVEQNRCYFKAGPADTFWTTCHGKINGSPFGKCVIFPKGKTTWDGFVPPCEFKDGDIVATTNGLFVGIIEVKNNKPVGAYCSVDYVKDFRINSDYVFDRLATPWEKEKLFKAIKDNGYKWNPETKTLEKLSLTQSKFDITTLVPFDKVLVRDNNSQKWTADLFSFYDKSLVYPYSCAGHYTNQCIPYEKNEHLLGKTDDCDEYFKTWEE